MAVPRRPSQGVTGFVQRLMSMRGLSSAVPGLSAQANGLLLAPQPDAYHTSSSEATRTLNGQPRANGHAVPTVLAFPPFCYLFGGFQVLWPTHEGWIGHQRVRLTLDARQHPADPCWCGSRAGTVR